MFQVLCRNEFDSQAGIGNIECEMFPNFLSVGLRYVEKNECQPLDRFGEVRRFSGC